MELSTHEGTIFKMEPSEYITLLGDNVGDGAVSIYEGTIFEMET